MSKYLGVELLSHRYMFSNVVTNYINFERNFYIIRTIRGLVPLIINRR